MNQDALDLLLKIRQKLHSLLCEAQAFPATADGHTLLAAEAGLGTGPITVDQYQDLREGTLLLGRSEGVSWMYEEIDILLNDWEQNNR